MATVNTRPQPLPLICFSLMAGVLLFGGVSLLVHRQPGWTPGTLPPLIDYALVAYTIVAVSIAVILKGRVARERDPQRRRALLVLGWSVCEGAGLLGAVIFYFMGEGQWFALGFLAMVASVVLLPPRETSGTASGVGAWE